MFKKLIFIMLIMHSLVGCVKEPTTDTSLADDFDRKSMLINLTDNYIVPGYAAYNTQILNLENNWNAFKANPDSIHIIEIRTAFNEALLTWQTISFLEFGPASSIALRAQTNIYPVDTSLINSNVNAGVTDVSSISNLPAKGFQTLDYLYFNQSSVSDQVSYLSQTVTSDYVEAILLDLKTNGLYVSDQWTSFRETFINNDVSNAVGSSVSNICNNTISHFETFIRKGKVGLPLGVFNGFSQLPLPSHVEGLYSQANLQYSIKSVEYLLKFLNGNAYNGNANGIGLLDYANYVEATVDGILLSEAIVSQMNSIIIHSQSIIGSWSAEVTTNAANHLNIYQEYQKLVPLLKVDLTSALGVSITFQDNDGD